MTFIPHRLEISGFRSIYCLPDGANISIVDRETPAFLYKDENNIFFLQIPRGNLHIITNLILRQCPVCGEVFVAKHSRTIICSDDCRKKHKAAQDKSRVRVTELRKCQCCGKPVRRGKNARTCSQECSDKMRSIRAAKYRAEDPERYRATSRRCYAKNGDKYRAAARAEYKEHKHWLSEQTEEVKVLMRKKKHGKLDT